jgi:Fur family transcriptional regulator, ferric uptake regulator
MRTVAGTSQPPDERLERVLAALAAVGARRTAPRQAIVEALLAADGHVTADELADEVQARFPSVNISTVYRTLETLEQAGVVDHVHLGHGRAVYHLADDDHQHLVCERCEQVIELPVSKLRPLLETLERDYGFEVDRRHFAIVGVCAGCREAV